MTNRAGIPRPGEELIISSSVAQDARSFPHQWTGARIEHRHSPAAGALTNSAHVLSGLRLAQVNLGMNGLEHLAGCYWSAIGGNQQSADNPLPATLATILAHPRPAMFQTGYIAGRGSAVSSG